MAYDSNSLHLKTVDSLGKPLLFEVFLYNPATGWEMNFGDEDASEEVDFVQWAPHPVGQTGNLLVSAGKPGTLVLEVMDVQGRVLRKWMQPKAAGEEHISFDLNLSSGMYVYRVQLNGKVDSGKLVIR